MFKKIILIILVAFMFIPTISFAETKEYVKENLKEALTKEGIEHDLGDYKESDKKINVYLFRGNGCGYCNRFLKFLNDNIEEYGQYFNLVSYEVMNNPNNAKLLTEVSTFMGGAVTSVPYIVIGDEVFSGFSEEEYGEKIKTAIKKLYDSKDKYDVFEEISKQNEEPKDNGVAIILCTLMLSIVSTGLILYVTDRQTKVLNARIELLEKNIQNLQKKK